MRKTRMIWIAVGVVVVGLAAWGPVASNVEQAKYEVVEAAGSFEIRSYAPHIVAETEVEGEREAAINEGFRRIADYIFGNNSAAIKVAMTAPVTQQQGEKIAMTAPVTQAEHNGKWRVRFVMPASYSMQTLPKPNNKDVVLKTVTEKRFAVVQFSGMAGEESIARHTAELETLVEQKKLRAVAKPTLAFYNPPWTLPFLRRNEVMVEIKK